MNGVTFNGNRLSRPNMRAGMIQGIDNIGISNKAFHPNNITYSQNYHYDLRRFRGINSQSVFPNENLTNSPYKKFDGYIDQNQLADNYYNNPYNLQNLTSTTTIPIGVTNITPGVGNMSSAVVNTGNAMGNVTGSPTGLPANMTNYYSGIDFTPQTMNNAPSSRSR